jgi:hypothetical protein
MHRPSPATAISLVAVFLALTGGAYAATKLPASSVGTKQIKKNAVTLTKIAPAARKALAGAVGPQGLAGAPGAPGADGKQGQQGVQGPQGAEGPAAKADANGNVYVAANGQPGETNTLRIGTTQTAAAIKGIYNGANGTDAVYVDSNGNLGTIVLSSRRLKRDIQPLRSVGRRLMRLRPVSFRYKSGNGAKRYGLIAEEVAKVFPELVSLGPGRRPAGLHMEQLPAILLAQVQTQQRQIDSLNRRIAHLERR